MGQYLGLTMTAVPAQIEDLPAPSVRQPLTPNGSVAPALFQANTQQSLIRRIRFERYKRRH